MTRPPKKSETLEVRLPYPTKQVFMARCREEGLTASEAVRDYIDQRLAPARPSRKLGRWVAGALLAAAAGAVALPSLARPGAGFDRLDLDHDGAVSQAELSRLDADHDGRVTVAELPR